MSRNPRRLALGSAVAGLRGTTCDANASTGPGHCFSTDLRRCPSQLGVSRYLNGVDFMIRVISENT